MKALTFSQPGHPLFQPLLHQMATGTLAEGDIAPPIPDILRHQSATVLPVEVQGSDLERLHLTSEARHRY